MLPPTGEVPDPSQDGAMVEPARVVAPEVSGPSSKVQGATAPRVVMPTSDSKISLFRKRDQDGDGRVSPTEWPGPPGDFARLDTNEDGYVDRAEATAAPRRSRTGQNAGVITRLDTDGDGRVSQAEFPGRVERFNVLDLNGDGYIDPSEEPSSPRQGDR